MKKIILIIISITMLIMFTTKEKYYVIPNEAIRLRIVANSNSIKDQYIKKQVKENIYKEIEEILKTSSLEESREIIQNNIEKIEKVVKETLEESGYETKFNIKFGNNYFPKKIYKNVEYKEGEYESLVITIGEGKGDNWWCVLFPPICSLEETDKNEIGYSLYVKELIEKYTK